MAAVLNNIGEEYVLETALAGVTLSVGLYNDGTDAIGDTDDLGAITTEPGSGNYARQSMTAELVNPSGDWVMRNASQISFDVTNTTETVDSYFIVANFDSDEAGDGGTATDHLIITGALSQSRDLSQIDTLNIDAGTAGISLD